MGYIIHCMTGIDNKSFPAWPVAASMTGLCLVAIMLARVVAALGGEDMTIANWLLCADALLFAFSTIASCAAKKIKKLEWVGGAALILGVVLMAATCCFIACTAGADIPRELPPPKNNFG